MSIKTKDISLQELFAEVAKWEDISGLLELTRAGKVYDEYCVPEKTGKSPRDSIYVEGVMLIANLLFLYPRTEKNSPVWKEDSSLNASIERAVKKVRKRLIQSWLARNADKIGSDPSCFLEEGGHHPSYQDFAECFFFEAWAKLLPMIEASQDIQADKARVLFTVQLQGYERS